MSITTSFNAGIAGLNANAIRLATIADNIANSSTFGYKRMEADFHSMVIRGNAPGMYSAGGVRATTARMIEQRGALVSSSNPTDIAVGGRGFLPVTNLLAAQGGSGAYPMSLVSTGSFRPDSNGILRTDTGMVLLGWPANPDGTIPSFPRDSVGGLQPVRIDANQHAGNPTTRVQLGVNLPATSTRAGADGEPIELSLEYFDNLGVASSMQVTFTPTVPADGASNTWTLTITDPDNDDLVVAEYTLEFDDSPENGGKLLSVTQAAGAPGGAYDPDTGEVSIEIGGNTIAMAIGGVDGQRGLTQLSDRFTTPSIVKDGSPVGNLVSVQVDASGRLNAIYDTGAVRTIYQIPLVDVPNPNGLISLDNQAYQVSRESGAMFLWDAGEGPTGEMIGFAREESTTDVAVELTQMIQTQRAYSSNAKVIQTVDEMLQETTNLKR